LKATAGATARTIARYACSSSWTSGWFWQFVPSRFHMKGTASSRSTSTPAFAKNSRFSSIAANTAGLV
jgi:hypothetical protein